MKNFIFVILMVIHNFAWCITPTDTSKSFNTLMYGVWAELFTSKGEILSYMVYVPEGKFHAFGYLDEEKQFYWFANGDWKMKDNQSCITFTFDSTGLMDLPEEFCVTVLSVTNDEFIYSDNHDGKIYTLKRVSTGYLNQ